MVWPMVHYEADDALASGAGKASQEDNVKQVIICTPDKDLSQCVVGTRVVQLDRRRDILPDEAGVVAKFGVSPQSIPDYLALVGDTADGFPVRDGAKKLRPSLYLSTRTSKTFRRSGERGIRQYGGPAHCPNHCSMPGTTPCCFARSRPCGWMFPSLIRFSLFVGQGRVPTLRNTAID